MQKVYILGILGGTLLILSEIFPLHSEYSAFDLIWLQDIIYWFPLCGGILILGGALFGLIFIERQIPTVLLQFSGLTITLLFLIEYLHLNWKFLNNAQMGLYLLIIGISITFLEIIWALLVKVDSSQRTSVN